MRIRNRVAALPIASLLAASGFMTAINHARAADPYDANLEARIEALERELNIVNGDAKGKNVEETQVPTYLRAAGLQVTQLTLSGSLRFRYNYDNEQFQYVTPSGSVQRSRLLFRLLLNMNYKFTNNWFAGVGLASNGQADAQNQPVTGGGDDYGIFLHKFFLGWKVSNFLTLVGGKADEPYYDNEDAIVDFGDITEIGMREEFNFDLSSQLNLKVNLGQYDFYDNPESGYSITPGTVTYTNTATGKTATTAINLYTVNPAGSVPDSTKKDPWLFYQEAVLTYQPANLITATLAPSFYFYAPHGAVGQSGNIGGASERNLPTEVITGGLQATSGALAGVDGFNSADASRSLYVAMFNGDVKFPVGPFKGKFFWDFAENLRGGNRAKRIYGVDETDFKDSTAWLTGFQLGELKRKGDWYTSIDYRQYGLASLDPNLNDPNFALSRLNTQGFRFNLGYNFETWLKGEIWYYGAWNLDNNVHLLSGARISASSPNVSIYDANAIQNLMLQVTAGF